MLITNYDIDINALYMSHNGRWMYNVEKMENMQFCPSEKITYKMLLDPSNIETIWNKISFGKSYYTYMENQIGHIIHMY